MATDGKKITVYVRAGDVRKLRAEGKDPAEWVRGLVKAALDKKMGR